MCQCVRDHGVGKYWKLKTAVIDTANPSQQASVKSKTVFFYGLQTLKHRSQTTSHHLCAYAIVLTYYLQVNNSV